MVDVILTLLKTSPPLQGKRILWPRELTVKPVRVVGSSGAVAANTEVTFRDEQFCPIQSTAFRQRLGTQSALRKKLLKMNLSCFLQSVIFHQAALNRIFNYVLQIIQLGVYLASTDG